MRFSFGEHALFRVGVFDEYETTAAMVAYDRPTGTVAVKRYYHCSCFGSADAVLGGTEGTEPSSRDVSSIEWDWQGPSDALADMARGQRHLRFPRRKLQDKDFDYAVMSELYKRYVQWVREDKPDWRNRKFKLALEH
ncbi:g7841 [Coccomyxa viridis]|uniref:G7841 protein n=1 Tax=Coccomyxa viridis TaxID=1274662 RepID=A0ABP1FYY9_9CHLO